MSRKIPPCTAIGPNPCFFGRIIWLEDAANRGACFPAPLPPLRKVGHRMAGAAPPRSRAVLRKKMAVEGSVFTLRGCAACPACPKGSYQPRAAAHPSGRGETDSDGDCHPVCRRHAAQADTAYPHATAAPARPGGSPQKNGGRGERVYPQGLCGVPARPGRAGRVVPAAGQRCVTGRSGNPRGSGRCAPSTPPGPPPSPRKTAPHTAARPAPWPQRWPPAAGGIWRACPTWSPQA